MLVKRFVASGWAVAPPDDTSRDNPWESLNV
jgi:hypothetical protein